jgi:hypothetical protein
MEGHNCLTLLSRSILILFATSQSKMDFKNGFQNGFSEWISEWISEWFSERISEF